MRRLITFPFIFLFIFSILSPFPPSLSGASRVIKIAILPWKLNAPDDAGYLKDALYDMMASRIGVEESLTVVEQSSIEENLKNYKRKDLTEDELRDIGRNVKADYVFQGSLSIAKGVVSLDAKVVKIEGKSMPIFSVSQGKGMDSLIPMVGRLALDLNARILTLEGLTPQVKGFGGSPQYVGTFKKKREEEKKGEEFLIVSREKEATERLWKSRSFSTALKGLAVGDLDGDGRNEIALIDDGNLWIYRKIGDSMELLWEEKGQTTMQNLFIDVGDINNNGISEVYVTRIGSNRLNSYVLEYDGKGYKKIKANLPWFFRVLREGETEVLLGQKTGGGELFAGDVVRLFWKDGRLAIGDALDLPRGINIYGFIYGDSKDGKVVFALDRGDRLKVYTKKEKWEEVWESKDLYGGSLNAVARSTTGFNIASTEERDITEVEYIKGRILFEDLNNDGHGEVIINRNISTLSRFLERLRSYKEGEIVNLEWDGISLEESWRTKPLEGYVADYQIKDIDGDKGKDLTVILVTNVGGIRKQPKSTILSYKLLTM